MLQDNRKTVETHIAASPTRFLDRKTVPHIVTLVLAAALGAIAMNMFLPSLPAMAAYFEADSSVVQLAVSLYLATTAALHLVFGPLSDKYGRRPLMIAGLLCFLVGTLICIFAPTIEVLLLGRMVQAGAISGVVLGRAVVRDLVSVNEAASMIGYITMAMTLGPMLAPFFGGLLDEYFNWQINFLAMGVFGLLVLAVVYFDLGETNKSKGQDFKTQFAAYPELLRSRRFWGYTATAAFAAGSFFAFLGGGPFIASTVFNLSPSEYGFYFGFTAVGYMLGNFLSGRYATRFGINAMMISGCLVTAIGLLVPISLLATGFTHPFAFFGPIIFVGIGNGMTLPSANAGIVSVRPRLAGSASGLGGALNIGGGAALAALTSSVVSVETGPQPLLYVMILSALCGVLATLYVIRVDRLVQSDAKPR